MRRSKSRDVSIFTVFFCLCLIRRSQCFANLQNEKKCLEPSTTSLFLQDREPCEKDVDSIVYSPVLRRVYPSLMEHVSVYGNPNIPLKQSGGRECVTLRRLKAQNKLHDDDISLLDSIDFIWYSLEDIYELQKDHFDDFMHRLTKYAAANDGDLSPPKKYNADPELGAWITALRRLKMVDAVDSVHVQQLDDIGFSWVSPRKCGSKFMLQYRAIRDRQKSDDTVLDDVKVVSWIQAQSQADLSETRKHYMAQMVGENWMDWKGSQEQ